MNIYQIASLGIIAVMLSITIKKDNPAISVMIGIAASSLIIIFILPQLSAVLEMISSISGKVKSSVPFIDPVLRILGISYIAEFASNIAADAGENAIASRIEFGGKIMIITVAAPIVFALINQVTYILE